MDISEALYQFISTNLTTIGGRIYPDIMPETEVYPAITYQLISVSPSHVLNRQSTGLQVCTYMFSIWAESRKITRQVGALLTQLLDNYQGQMAEGIYIQSIMKISEDDIFDDGIYGKKIEFSISFNKEE